MTDQNDIDDKVDGSEGPILTKYDISATVEAESLLDAWDKATRIPADFSLSGWGDFGYFSIYETETGREISMTNYNKEEK